MACNSVNLFNALTGNDPGGVFYDVDGLFGAPGSVVATPTALDFTGVADGTYAFQYEICIDCDLDGNTNDPGECDTVDFNVEVYNLPSVADIGLCIDDPQWYTVIGDPGANPTHITLIDGDPADYIVGGNPSGLPSSFTAAGLGAGYNSTITITLAPASGAPVQCACMTVFNVEVEGLPSTSVVDEDILCISCTGPTYDLTSITGYIDETWYKTNTTGGGTCDGTTVNSGTFTGALVTNPAAEPINEGINTFWAVQQISGGPCGDRYVCQEVEIYGVPTAPANIPDALVIAEPNQDICACVGDYDIDVGPGLDCWEDFYQILLNAGANVVLNGYGETATLPNGVYASYTWDVCDSSGASILNATNNTSDMDYNTLQINCDDFIGIPDGNLTVKITVTTGFSGTECLNDTYELTIPHTSCCEDCTYILRGRDSVTGNLTELDTLSAGLLTSSLYGVGFFVEIFVDKDCDTSPDSETVVQTWGISGRTRRLQIEYNDYKTNEYNIILVSGTYEAVQNGGTDFDWTTINSAADLLSTIQSLSSDPTAFQLTSTKIYVTADTSNSDGFNENTLDVQEANSALVRGDALYTYTTPCGDINVDIASQSASGLIDHSLFGLPNSGANIEVWHDRYVINNSTPTSNHPINYDVQQTLVCEECN